MGADVYMDIDLHLLCVCVYTYIDSICAPEAARQISAAAPLPPVSSSSPLLPPLPLGGMREITSRSNEIGSDFNKLFI